MKKVRPEVLIRPHLYGVISAPMENSKGAESNRKGPWSGQEIGALRSHVQRMQSVCQVSSTCKQRFFYGGHKKTTTRLPLIY
jgi:hypothetical protein